MKAAGYKVIHQEDYKKMEWITSWCSRLS